MPKYTDLKQSLKELSRQELENLFIRLLSDTLFVYLLERHSIKDAIKKADEMQSKHPDAYSYSKNKLREVS